MATLSGMGWIGKCALLVNDSYGTAVRYITVLTDAAVAVRDASQVLPLRLLHGLCRCLPGRSTFRPGVGGGAET